jgi:hypothetical protein
MFLGLPDPDQLVRERDQDPALDLDPSIILLSPSKNSKKNLDSYYYVTSLDLLSLKDYATVMYLQKVIRRKLF